MKNFIKKHKIEYLYFDWKEIKEEALEEIIIMMKKFKVFIYVDPVTEGNDGYGIIISKDKLTTQQVKDCGAFLAGYDNWKKFKEDEL